MSCSCTSLITLMEYNTVKALEQEHFCGDERQKCYGAAVIGPLKPRCTEPHWGDLFSTGCGYGLNTIWFVFLRVLEMEHNDFMNNTAVRVLSWTWLKDFMKHVNAFSPIRLS